MNTLLNLYCSDSQGISTDLISSAQISSRSILDIGISDDLLKVCVHQKYPCPYHLTRFSISTEDFTAQGFKSRPYPEDSPIPYTNLSPVREKEWEKEARKSIKLIARTFKGADGEFRSGPVILWRTLHHPHRHNYAPYPVCPPRSFTCRNHKLTATVHSRSFRCSECLL